MGSKEYKFEKKTRCDKPKLSSPPRPPQSLLRTELRVHIHPPPGSLFLNANGIAVFFRDLQFSASTLPFLSCLETCWSVSFPMGSKPTVLSRPYDDASIVA